jgi:Domain of unknown function DUF29
MSTYERDYYGWTVEQAARLKRLQPEGLDWENLADEVIDLGHTERDKLESHLRILLIHLLKWKYQPRKRSGSWQASIINPRKQVARVLKRSPGLKPKLDEIFAEAYEDARAEAGGEMKLKRRQWEGLLPAVCEWTIGQVLEDFWPDDDA